MHRTRPHSLLLLLLALLAAACGADAPVRRIKLVTTTSVRDSGLMDALLPEFTKETGIGVDVIAVGTGAAFQQARDGNADLLVVHDRKGEDEFVASGHGRERRDLMWNTFEIAGPKDDPAGVRKAPTAADAFKAIALAQAPFISRGDDSGTHRREVSIWKKAGITPAQPWHQQSGQGMGPTLTIADEKKAYVLTDRGTRLSYRAKTQLDALLGGTEDLKNHYAVIVLSEERHPALAHREAGVLADWLVSAKTADRIGAFKVDGEALFVPARAPQ